MDIDHYMQEEFALDLLAQHLEAGTLVLFIGAGVSKQLGFPDWQDFVNKIRRSVSLTEPDSYSSAEDLQLAADEVKDLVNDDYQFNNLLKEALYEHMPSLSMSVLTNKLLVSIGAMLMGSNRGNVQRVVTLNYDSLLEWYLSLFGFVVRVVNEFPDLEGAEDVRIYHPHGFLPHPLMHELEDSNEVILGFRSVNQRLGSPNDEWFEVLRHIISNGFCLFVGMSEDSYQDRSLNPLFTSVGSNISGFRPTGLWILKGAAKSQNSFLKNNMIPFSVEEYEDIPDFLLKICQKAAAKIIL